MSAYLSPYVWASETDYPGGSNAWNGQPLAIQPSQDYFVPNTKPPAEWFNWLFQQTSLQFQFVYSQVASVAPLNWGTEFASGGFAALQQECAAWAQANRLFALGAVTTSGTPLIQVWVTYGTDAGATAQSQWFQFGPNLLTSNGWLYSAVAEDPTDLTGFLGNHFWVAGTDNVATHNALHVYHTDGSTWTLHVSLTSTGYYYGAEIATLAGRVIIGIAGTGDNWLLSRVISGANHDFSPAITMAAGSTWCLKSNGTQAVAIPSSVGLTTVYTTTDGISWTTSTGLTTALGGSAATSTVVGLAYSIVGGPCWIAAIQPTSGAPTFYTSPDGGTWTKQTGGITATLTITDMAAIGNALVAVLADNVNTSSNAIYSLDCGVTWYPTPGWLTINSASSTPGYSRPRIVASDIGFMFFNSILIRFSANQWVPALQL